ncbi:hypothetical protein BJD11_05955 [Xanthomonas euvesicatoria]|nr:hypothetical protein BJD11_05955 [Xanthomonas euvesicatoria]
MAGSRQEQLGFAVGCKLQITARAGKLVVTVVER